ncbi:MAG: indole-3-glycerol phosphate synthase TrpC [Deltaproteobacteria bacterium]|nr:indole-3-glycerol phosphate synthase TrpC [Deltaproteobacteria bacterium]
MTHHILDAIVEQKHREIAALLQKTPEKQLRELALRSSERRPFLERLRHPGQTGINIIAEIKRASPSKGMLCPDLDPVALARSYESGGAACLSVLTDRQFFQGSPEDLLAARAATQLPVLRKDFLISSCQIYESCILGADAVLLIARILSEAQLSELLDLCHALGMNALVEVHSESDVAAATRSGARLIGINNRNLQTFHTDIATSMQLVSQLASDQIPVAASGIQNRQDIERLSKSGIFNFLIGESLVRSKDPAGFLQTLME